MRRLRLQPPLLFRYKKLFYGGILISDNKGLDLTDGMTNIFYHTDIFKNWTKGGLKRLDEEVRKIVRDKPLYISEWNSCAIFGAPVHDEKYSACFIVKTCLDSAHLTDGYMFWCCSDIFEEI